MTLTIQKPTGAKLVLSKIQQYPAVLGEPWGGGYFAGYISHTADGNPTHALIVASRLPVGGKAGASGEGYDTGFTGNYVWATATGASSFPLTTGVTDAQLLADYSARSAFDGAVNVAIMKANFAGIAEYPAAKFCDDLNSGSGFGGQTDWYLPSRHECDIAYFNLKSTTDQNATVGGVQAFSPGVNPYSVPRRDSNYTLTYPMQTSVTLFASGNAEAFPSGGRNHWTSQEAAATRSIGYAFANGAQSESFSKTLANNRVRAFRKIAL